MHHHYALHAYCKTCNKLKQKLTISEEVHSKNGNGVFNVPVFAPESKLFYIHPIFLHCFIAFESRVRIPQKKSAIQNQ